MTGHDPIDELARRMAESEDPLQALGRRESDPAAADDVEALMRRLERAGADERRTLAEASSAPAAPGDELVRDTIAQLAGVATAGPARPRAARRMGWWAAAAALVLAFSALYFTQRGRTESPQLLGQGDLELVQPLGEVEHFGAFVWEGQLAEGHWFELKLYREEQGLAGEQVLASGRLSRSQWEPTAAELEALPRSLVWEVLERDASGERVDSRQGRARRSE